MPPGYPVFARERLRLFKPADLQQALDSGAIDCGKPSRWGGNDRMMLYTKAENEKLPCVQFKKRRVLSNCVNVNHCGGGVGGGGDASAVPNENVKVKYCIDIEMTREDYDTWAAWQRFVTRTILPHANRWTRQHLTDSLKAITVSPNSQMELLQAQVLTPVKMRKVFGRGGQYKFSLRFNYSQHEVAPAFMNFRRGDVIDFMVLLNGVFYEQDSGAKSSYRFLNARLCDAPDPSTLSPVFTVEQMYAAYPDVKPAGAISAATTTTTTTTPSSSSASSSSSPVVTIASKSVETVLGPPPGKPEDYLYPDASKAECGVCLGANAEVVALPCRHVGYCKECLDSCIKSKKADCAYCRTPITHYTLLTHTLRTDEAKLFYVD